MFFQDVMIYIMNKEAPRHTITSNQLATGFHEKPQLDVERSVSLYVVNAWVWLGDITAGAGDNT